MTDYSDDPFQMDEDISPETTKLVTNSNIVNNGNVCNIKEEIVPRSSEIKESNLYNDRLLIRSKLSQFKLEEIGVAGTTTTEEEDQTCDEDIDDKFDYNLQKKIEQDYENLKNLRNLKQPLTPPENFAPIVNKIYRSSFPQPQNFTFLKKLKLKSILCLIPEEYPSLQLEFLKDENIKLFQLGMSGNKEPFVKISSELITEAVKSVLNPENQPILIHCNRGKHRTGCLVGVLRRLQNWSLTIIFDEYRKFAAPKERPMDQQFIELYDDTEIVEYCKENSLLPLRWD